jgi:hypothetical protein
MLSVVLEQLDEAKKNVDDESSIPNLQSKIQSIEKHLRTFVSAMSDAQGKVETALEKYFGSSVKVEFKVNNRGGPDTDNVLSTYLIMLVMVDKKMDYAEEQRVIKLFKQQLGDLDWKHSFTGADLGWTSFSGLVGY